MKKKDRYKIINYAVKDFNETFKHNVKPIKYSRKYINKTFEKYKYWSMVDASYCCHGWQRNCWEDYVEDGVWEHTVESAKKTIREIIECCHKYLHRDERLYIEENEKGIIIFITCRDVEFQNDLRIIGTNKQDD